MNTNSRTEVAIRIPKQKPAQACMKNCTPKLSRGCDICSNCCSDYYISPMGESVGITGLLYSKPCITYDEQWGGCGTCIGCEDSCDVYRLQPFPGYVRTPYSGA